MGVIELNTDNKILFTDDDRYMFNEGTHFRLYQKLGAHPTSIKNQAGTSFAVWAPDAKQVSVIGDFNQWNAKANQLSPCGSSGVWAGFVPNVGQGAIYKYHIKAHSSDYSVDKADPFGFHQETPPKTGSIVWDISYDWGDQNWLEQRAQTNHRQEPISIYEVHLGSWMRVPEDNNRSLSYREIAPHLAAWVKELGFTHVELLPIMEHPFFGSWGYQTTGYFAPTSRYGTPQDFMYLIDHLHQEGIGIILDWVPSHFPSDEHGLAFFDGTHLFEHDDPRQGFHPDWNSNIFNYGRHEIRSFLISSAAMWIDKYHADGIRVDAVASMLYLDYSRNEGEWIPNKYGGRENLEAIEFMKMLNTEIYGSFPGVQTYAEESTAWPMVSRPTYVGGLGFGFKWDMGWMHDTLEYMKREPVHRKFHHGELTFRMIYAFNENFVLPLSHDEVVHQKGSLLDRMPGDDWQKHANLRLLYGYMYAQPGKKLLFMGQEFASCNEWNHDTSIDWHMVDQHFPQGVKNWIADLNRLYRQEKALYQLDFEGKGHEWIGEHAEESTLIFLRKGTRPEDMILVACNFTPVFREGYRIGVPQEGTWKEVANSDDLKYAGSGQINSTPLTAEAVSAHGRPYSITINIPPLGITFFRLEKEE
jgi:1,4-alpha-glucan branching enzyme